MGVAEFRSDNDAYLRWVAEHADGFVINIQRSLNPSDARVHRATCQWIRGRPPRGQGFAGAYIKICCESLAELSEWARNRVLSPIRDCGTCRPTGSATSGKVTGRAERPGGTRPSLRGSGSDAKHEIEGPTANLREVWLWAYTYIPFQHLSTAQLAARAMLQDRLALLSAGPGELPHASYKGHKPGNMDIENLLLYNIGGQCFRPSGWHGVRFEMADGPRRRPASGRPFDCSYRYRLIRSGAELAHWRPVRRLACFADVSLGAFPAHARLAQTWFAVRRDGATLADRGISYDSVPFAVLLTLSCPQRAVAWPSPNAT